jgi:hypothetical protein
MGDRLKVARADPISVRMSHNVGRARGQADWLCGTSLSRWYQLDTDNLVSDSRGCDLGAR